VGFAGFTEHAYRMGAYLDFAHFDPALLANTSNQYIEAAVNGGLIGLTLYVVLMLRVLHVAHRTMRLAALNMQLPLMGISSWLMGVVIGMHTAILILPTSLICLYFFACACFSEKFCSLLSAEKNQKRPIKNAPKHNLVPTKRPIAAQL
jgi:O-antigen ligase